MRVGWLESARWRCWVGVCACTPARVSSKLFRLAASCPNTQRAKARRRWCRVCSRSAVVGIVGERDGAASGLKSSHFRPRMWGWAMSVIGQCRDLPGWQTLNQCGRRHTWQQCRVGQCRWGNLPGIQVNAGSDGFGQYRVGNAGSYNFGLANMVWAVIGF